MTTPFSRRRFLQTAGASAAVWVPASVNGYTTSEVAAMATGERLEVGLSMWELDTPALVVDLDALEGNLVTMQETVRANGIASRPHAKTHKCPAIARLQIATGSVGICTARSICRLWSPYSAPGSRQVHVISTGPTSTWISTFPFVKSILLMSMSIIYHKMCVC